jgi:L-arabinokinase
VPPTLAYFVSGHGFGHARRTAAAIRAIHAQRPDVRVVVRTNAPASLFEGLPNATVSTPPRPFDPGVVERDALSIDPAASLQRLAEVLRDKPSIVGAEAQFLRDSGATLVAADIPFLAADAASAAGLPAIAVGNFTWDWIFEAYPSPQTPTLVEAIRDSYRKFDILLHLPLGHEPTAFRHVIEVPLLTNHPRQPCEVTLAQLQIDPSDPRPKILLALRGGLPPDAVSRAAAESPDCLFLVNQPLVAPPPNLHSIQGLPVDFTEIVAACDVVVSKPGYGILTDCIAGETALLFPPRTGFREDDVSRETCPRYLRMRELPPGGFHTGRWRPHLTALLAQPTPPERIPTNGDQTVARLLVERL